MEDGEVPQHWDSWVNALKRPKRWICGLSLRAAADRLKVQVIIVKKVDGNWGTPMAVGAMPKKGETPVVLAFHDEHYTLLMPKTEDAIRSSWCAVGFTDPVALSQNSLRGAAKKQAPSAKRPRSVGSGQGWLPPTPTTAKEDKSHGTVGLGDGWLPCSSAASSTGKIRKLSQKDTAFGGSWLPGTGASSSSKQPAAKKTPLVNEGDDDAGETDMEVTHLFGPPERYDRPALDYQARVAGGER